MKDLKFALMRPVVIKATGVVAIPGMGRTDREGEESYFLLRRGRLDQEDERLGWFRSEELREPTDEEWLREAEWDED